MKLVTAIIKPFKLDDVREGLSEIGQSIFKDMVRRERLLVLKPFYAEVIG